VVTPEAHAEKAEIVKVVVANAEKNGKSLNQIYYSRPDFSGRLFCLKRLLC
jgi:hypothetical protein